MSEAHVDLFTPRLSTEVRLERGKRVCESGCCVSESKSVLKFSGLKSSTVYDLNFSTDRMPLVKPIEWPEN